MDWRLWKHAKKLGVKCSINPDAHSIGDLKYLAVGIGIARKGWLTKANAINCWSLPEVGKVLPAFAAKRSATLNPAGERSR